MKPYIVTYWLASVNTSHEFGKDQISNVINKESL